jgi:branched-chain amino acid transport system permease protein
MTWPSILIQFLNGLSAASALFLTAAGLSLIFGVTRIVNFAHGSLYMLGMYLAASLAPYIGFWWSVPCAALTVAAAGALIERGLLARLYGAPELLQLLATFALVMVIKDYALWQWGPEDILGPRAPGLDGAVALAGQRFPEYDLFLIAVGPAVLGALWLALRRTRWGVLVRAATQDRDMADALGINQRLLFTTVFAAGAFLAGLGGALQIPREPATLHADLAVVTDAFVVVVLGGLGSIPGAFVAALLIGLVKSYCVGLGLSKATLVIEFLVMAAVLIARPWGLFGSVAAPARAAAPEPPLALPSRRTVAALAALLAALALVPVATQGYALILLTDILVFALFAVSLHFISGPAGLHSFGHAAYFGLGAYAAGLMLLRAAAPTELALVAAPLVAAIGAAVFGWFCVRASGIYAAMLTLSFAQIAWSVAFQWDAFTGGSNGLVGVWPQGWLASKTAYYYFVLASSAAAIALLWRALYSPFGYALRAVRDSRLRAEAIGMDPQRLQWAAFAFAGLFAGIAGALYAFSKGSISPETMAVPRSVEGLVMVLLGGIQTLTGPVWGAAALTWLQDTLARTFDYWRAAIGLVILVLTLALPQGLGGLLPARSTR